MPYNCGCCAGREKAGKYLEAVLNYVQAVGRLDRKEVKTILHLKECSS